MPKIEEKKEKQEEIKHKKEKQEEIKHLESKYAIDKHFSEMSEEEIWGEQKPEK